MLAQNENTESDSSPLRNSVKTRCSSFDTAALHAAYSG